MKQNIARWFQDAWYKEMYFSNIFVPFAMIFDLLQIIVVIQSCMIGSIPCKIKS